MSTLLPSASDSSGRCSQSESDTRCSSSDSELSPESESDSEEESGRNVSRPRPQWRHVWSSMDNTGRTFEALKQTLPTHVVAKNDPYKCTMKHASVGQYELANTLHKMRTILTACVSARCDQSRLRCACRYKINESQESDYVTVVQEGEHTMVNALDFSPRATRGLTEQVKLLVHAALSRKYSVAPHVVYTDICARMPDQTPLESQVQGYMQRWRRNNRDDSMDPVIDICREFMFELASNVAQHGEKLFVFCDSRRANDRLVPDIGDASDELPFRIGLACYLMLEMYINIQQDPRCVTILHVDSTHNIVRQKYNVFILGISDSCAHFFPVIYYCASQRRAEDVGWCLSYLKRVTKQLFAVEFAPRFVMTDADKAQYKACATELPKAKVLMCWFHVRQHAWKKSKTLPKLRRETIFRGLNDLHFCRTETEFDTKKLQVVREWTSIGVTCPRFRTVAKSLIRQWINNPRFSNWQTFHTQPGYATTNNPVEQYHRTLKLEDSSHATPIDMVKFLDQSRIEFLAKKAKFAIITEASKRLKAHYNRIKIQGQLQAKIFQPVGELRPQLVAVKHLTPLQLTDNTVYTQRDDQPSDASEGLSLNGAVHIRAAIGKRTKKNAIKKSEFHADDVTQHINSAHTLRTQWEGMPEDGWIVDATSRACQCRFHSKYNMCPHIIEATKVLELPCPGYKQVRRFKSCDTRSRRKTARQIRNLEPDAGYAGSGRDGVSVQSSRQCSSSLATMTTLRPAEVSEPSGQADSRVPLATPEFHVASVLGNTSAPTRIRCPAVPAIRDSFAYSGAIATPPPTTLVLPRAPISQRGLAAHRSDPIRSDGILHQVPRQVLSPIARTTRSASRESCEHTKRRRC